MLLRCFIAVIVIVATTSCIESKSELCSNGVRCEIGYSCSSDGRRCVQLQESLCGNGIIEPPEECDNGADNSKAPDAACRPNCQWPACGDGTVDSDEVCDDGRNESGDGCSADCQSNETCGNGTTDADAGERCDDGNNNNRDGCSARCRAETLAWNQRNFAPPLGRAHHAMAYDAIRKHVVLFGGSHNPGTAANETWAWDGGSWYPIVPTGNSPPSRRGHAMAYDAARGRVVLFGGDGFDGGGHKNDTWEWDGASWHQIEPEGPSPSPRLDHAMVYDEVRERVILFGGDAGGVEGDIQNDLWEWDGASWHRIEVHGPSPSARSNHSMAYDSARRRVVLFGGNIPDDGNDDGSAIWEWDGASWQQIASESLSPSPNFDYAMAYDAARGRVVLFGDDDDAGDGADNAATWEWDGASWYRIQSPGSTPSPRSGSAMVYDAARGHVVLFGGSFDSQALNDTWVWGERTWQSREAKGPSPSPRYAHAMAYDGDRGRVVLFGGAFDGGRFADTWEWTGQSWRLITPLDGVRPRLRQYHAMAYDRARGRTVLFGGYSGGEMGDTWVWDGSSWQSVATQGVSPPARYRHAMAYDSARKRVVLFGGGISGRRFGDTWEWDGTLWHHIEPQGPSPAPRRDHAMAYDAARERVVLFGGDDDSVWEWDGELWHRVEPEGPAPPARGEHAMAYDAVRERVVLFHGNRSSGSNPTWEWDGRSWHAMARQEPSPSPRYAAAMAYDAGDGRVILFGGYDGSFRNGTWAWDGRAWHSVVPVGFSQSPPPRVASSMAYDAEQGHAVLFGGHNGAVLQSEKQGDTWVWNGHSWRFIQPDSDAPSARYGHSMVYDGARGHIVLFGGDDGSRKNDTWVWEGETWRRAEQPPYSPPPPRSGHATAYDAARQRIVLFGGCDSSPSQTFGDTWEWDGDGQLWRLMSPPGPSPSPRYDHAMAYDAARGLTVLFGGSSRDDQDGSTWVWDGTSWQRIEHAEESAPSPRSGHTMAYHADRGRVILFGGSGDGPKNDMWEWDGASWHEIETQSPMPSPRSGHATAYDAARGRIVVFGGKDVSVTDDTWHLGYTTIEHKYEHCSNDVDNDGDGSVGCDDSDCWAYCEPLCMPHSTTCDSQLSYCGDGHCNRALENRFNCEIDCQPMARRW